MKIIFTFLKNSKVRILLLIIAATAGTLVFQANMPDRFDDNNPYIDQPTRESFSHFTSPNNSPHPLTITDANGYDNFEMSTDYYEQHLSSNPANPLWLFFGVNSYSAQNARNSTDAGITWNLVNPSHPGGTCCDPWSTYLSNGKLIYGSGVSGEYTYISTNNGNTWTSPVLAVYGVDRNTLASEITGTGPYANYVYAAITSGSYTTAFARSTDQAASWTTTYTYSHSQPVYPGCMIAVGPNGSTNGGNVVLVTNMGTSSANVSYLFHRSTDGGATFTLMSTINVAGYVGTLNSQNRPVINNARTRPYPMIAYDISNGPYRGRLYLVYASNVPAGNGNKPDIKCQYSTDQGANWSSYVVVNDDQNTTTNDQWYPAIWCEPNTGKLYVKWYDDRNGSSNYTVDVYASYSTDGGNTFVTNQELTNAPTTNWPCPSCPPNSNCYRGDYDGITANPYTSFSVWADHRNCAAANMGAYFPDFALLINPASVSVNTTNDSNYVYVKIPSVKLYTDKAKFTAPTITPTPGSGTVTFTYRNRTTGAAQDSLTSYPDSLKLVMKTTGGVTSGTYTVTLMGKGSNGTPVHLRTFTLNVNPLGISNNYGKIPDKFHLYQNFPNPFNPSTRIMFDLAKGGAVKLNVYDITGKLVSNLVNTNYEAGRYDFEFDGSKLASGVYFYKLETPEYTGIKKMILVK